MAHRFIKVKLKGRGTITEPHWAIYLLWRWLLLVPILFDSIPLHRLYDLSSFIRLTKLFYYISFGNSSGIKLIFLLTTLCSLRYPCMIEKGGYPECFRLSCLCVRLADHNVSSVSDLAHKLRIQLHISIYYLFIRIIKVLSAFQVASIIVVVQLWLFTNQPVPFLFYIR